MFFLVPKPETPVFESASTWALGLTFRVRRSWSPILAARREQHPTSMRSEGLRYILGI